MNSSDLPESETQAQLEDVNQKIQRVKQRYPDSRTTKGGLVCLVSTHQPINEWKPIAIRHLSEMEWTWQT